MSDKTAVFSGTAAASGHCPVCNRRPDYWPTDRCPAGWHTRTYVEWLQACAETEPAPAPDPQPAAPLCQEVSSDGHPCVEPAGHAGWHRFTNRPSAAPLSRRELYEAAFRQEDELRAKVATLEADAGIVDGIIDVLQKHCRGLRGAAPNRANLVELIDAINDTSSRFQQEKQQAENALFLERRGFESSLTSARLAREEAEAIHKTTHTAWCITSSRLEEVVSLYEKEKDRALAAEAEARTLRAKLDAAAEWMREIGAKHVKLGAEYGPTNDFGKGLEQAGKNILSLHAQWMAALTPPDGEEQT